jgi:hypothetical protein
MSKGLAANVNVTAGVDGGVQAAIEKCRQKLIRFHAIKIDCLPDDEGQRRSAYRADAQRRRLIGRSPATSVGLRFVDRQQDRNLAMLYLDGETSGALHDHRPVVLRCFGMAHFLS